MGHVAQGEQRARLFAIVLPPLVCTFMVKAARHVSAQDVRSFPTVMLARPTNTGLKVVAYPSWRSSRSNAGCSIFHRSVADLCNLLRPHMDPTMCLLRMAQTCG